jgi:molybdate-binding protein
LDFIPLFEERYDLIAAQEELSNPFVLNLFEDLNTLEVRNQIAGLAGYRIDETGREIQVK